MRYITPMENDKVDPSTAATQRPLEILARLAFLDGRLGRDAKECRDLYAELGEIIHTKQREIYGSCAFVAQILGLWKYPMNEEQKWIETVWWYKNRAEIEVWLDSHIINTESNIYKPWSIHSAWNKHKKAQEEAARQQERWEANKAFAERMMREAAERRQQEQFRKKEERRRKKAEEQAQQSHTSSPPPEPEQPSSPPPEEPSPPEPEPPPQADADFLTVAAWLHGKGKLNRYEAETLFGVGVPSCRAEVLQVIYRYYMQKYHADKPNGNHELGALLNMAKQALRF